MKEQLTKLTRKGQITVPAEVRRALGLERGDKVAIAVDGDRAYLRPVRSVADMTFGVLSSRGHPPDVRGEREVAMEEIAENAAAEGRQDLSDRR